MTAYHLEHAWVGGAVRGGVTVEIEDGRFRRVTTDRVVGAVPLAGLTIPGIANCHSHAFHRALRARAQQGSGDFWTWREQMYAVAERLDPPTYRLLATAVFREMVAAGITAVGEFHYLHHRPDGSPYEDADGGPNATGEALIDAALDAGLRITLLDACYLTAAVGEPVRGVQRRFSDGDAEQWSQRVERLRARAGSDVVVGAAIHSVRAVPRDDMQVVAAWAHSRSAPLHVHVSEQVAENEQCAAAYGRTPTQVLAEAGALTGRTTVVHGTHLTGRDVALMGDAAAATCFCPTTERDLGDGVGPSRVLHRAGSPITLGSDSHAVVDPFEEMRALETDERLTSTTRGHWAAAELLEAATAAGHRSLGFADAGRIEVGLRADLVTLDLTSPRTAGCGPTAETAVFAATAADVVQVVAGGRVVHRREDAAVVGALLGRAVAEVWR